MFCIIGNFLYFRFSSHTAPDFGTVLAIFVHIWPNSYLQLSRHTAPDNIDIHAMFWPLFLKIWPNLYLQLSGHTALDISSHVKLTIDGKRQLLMRLYENQHYDNQNQDTQHNNKKRGIQHTKPQHNDHNHHALPFMLRVVFL
jgi:hypothetical protein